MSYRKILILSLAVMLVLSASLVSTLLTQIPPAHATGGLASVSSVQLDAQSTSQTDTAVLGTLTTAATFRVGAVVSGGANPSPAQALSTDTLFKFCVFITTTVPPGCSTTATVWAAGAIVIRDVNNDGIYQTGEPVVAGAAPPTTTAGFRPDPNIKFIDSNGSSAYDFGETVVYATGGVTAWPATGTLPFIGPSVFGWQFGINYDPSVLVPQADPTSTSGYPDGAGSTILLGGGLALCPIYGGAAAGGCNWNGAGTQGLIAIAQRPTEIIVGFTYLAPHGPALINTNTLLANVAFEIISRPTSGTTTLSLNVPDLKLVDINAVPIPLYVAGSISTDTVTITNNPPTASFAATQLPPGDASCTPITGLPCSNIAFRFDGSASVASGTATIANPTGYFWDFGDGTQDSSSAAANLCPTPTGFAYLTCNQGPMAIHDFDATVGGAGPGTYDVTLRVVDNAGATGSARDTNGATIVNAQPSHMALSVVVALPLNPTSTSVSCTPSSVAFGASTTCTATVTDTSATPTTPTGTVAFTSSGTGTFTTSPCTLSGTTASATCSATFSPTGTTARTDTITASYSVDAGHSTSSGTFPLAVTTGVHSTTTTVSCTPSTVAINQATSCTATVSDTSTTGATTPTGTVNFSPSGTCALVAGTGATASCSASVVPSAAGSLTVTGTYVPDTTHSPSSGTTSVTVTIRDTATLVSCTSPVTTGSSTTCTASVVDISPNNGVAVTGTVSFTSSAGALGAFTGSPCTLALNVISFTCTVTYVPTSALPRTDVITANYINDASHAASSGTFGLSVTVPPHPTLTTVSCTPSTVAVGVITLCTATVTDTSTSGATAPSGNVNLNPGGPCTLATPTTISASCSVPVTPSATGSLTVSADYVPSDPIHSSSTGTTSVTVILRSTTTSVTCPPTGTIGVALTCSATVTDSNAGSITAPTGTMNFTPTAACTLSGTSTCTISITPDAAGSLSVTANYAGDPTHATSSGSTTVTVAKRITTTTIACVPNPVIVGSATICTATVTDTDAGTAITPSGTVTITSSGTGSILTSPCTLSGTGATVTCSVNYTPSGTPVPRTDTITAAYSGDTNHLTSTNTVNLPVTAVVLHSTTTTVTCTPSTIPFDPTGLAPTSTTTNCNATVVDPSAFPTTPTGPVTFTQTGIALGASFTGNPCTLSPTTVPPTGTAQCNVNFSSATIGTASITAAYAGDSGHTGSDNTATPATVTVTIHPTQTFVSCLTPIVPGQSSDCNAIVDDTIPVLVPPDPRTPPSGAVSFTTSGSGSFTSPQCTLIVGQNNAQTSCTVTYTPAGTTLPFTDTITATYSGDSTHSAGTPGTGTVTVNKRLTVTTINCTPSSITTAQTSSCTATVDSDATPGTGITPTGTVTFGQTGILTGASFVGNPCTLVPGAVPSSASCSVTFSSISTGTASITGAFDGDSTHAGSISSLVFSLQVTAVTLNPTTTTVSCTSPVALNQASSCTATVTDTSASPTSLAGTVTFSTTFPGSFDSTSCTLASAASGSADCSVHFTSVFAHSGTANIDGTYTPTDTTHSSSSTTTPASITVTLRSTSITINCVTPVSQNSPSTCTATVIDTSPGQPYNPFGFAFFTSSGAAGTFDSPDCVVQPSGPPGEGRCLLNFTPSAIGTADISASYMPGDLSATIHLASSTATPFSITVTPPTVHSATTTISCNPSSVVVGQSSTCTATVTDTSATGATIPTGMVTFTPGGSCTLQTATVPSATCSVTVTPINLAVTLLPVTASYAGDSSHSGSTSNTFSLAVTARSTTTSITCVPSPVNTGSPTICTVSVTDTDVGGFIPPLGQVTVSSSGTGTVIGSPCNLSGTSATTTCHVTYTPGGTAPRSDKLTADYTPATTHLASSGNFQLSITTQVPPVASFTESATTIPTLTAINFDASASTAPSGTITSYAWDFGDTMTGTGVTATHSYAKAGTYTVMLTVTDNLGHTGTASATKTITDRPPTASFAFTPAAPVVGQSVSFDAAASTDPDGTVTTYAWNFGDTTTGTGVTVAHTYSTQGSFTVTLTVTDNSRNTATTSRDIRVTQQVTNPGHAKLIQWRADAKFNPDNLRRNPTQVLRAYGLNDGTVTVNVYVQFSVTNPDGTTNTIYTQVVSLTPGQSINGRVDNRFTASFTTLPGRTNVTATIFYSSISSTIGDLSFKPDTASAKTFSFNALGIRTDEINFEDDITSTSQTFDISIQNAANIDLISRIDITIRQPDGTATNYVSDSLLLQTGRNGEIKFIVPLTGPDGTYCFTATVKYGIDTNHNGQLDNNEILGTIGRQHDCFSADTDDAPAGSIIAPPMTIAHVSTDDCDD